MKNYIIEVIISKGIHEIEGSKIKFKVGSVDYNELYVIWNKISDYRLQSPHRLHMFIRDLNQ